jgi:hypothetical protein
MSVKKPREKEEEYFARIEFEKRIKAIEERQKKLVQEERQQAKELHYMHCPKCGMELAGINYQGVKIDRCSACHGIWLDAGELEEILKKENLLSKITSLFK